MVNIHFVYSEESHFDELSKFRQEKAGDNSLAFHVLHSVKDKTKARQLKARWGARKDPFIIVLLDDKPLKAFYTETGENIVESLKQFINVELPKYLSD